MIAVIQTIPERYEHAQKQSVELGLHTSIYTDKDKDGPFKAFIETLRQIPSNGEYRLHMQDDLILCDDLKEYLPHLEQEMDNKGIDLLSLFAPRRKHIKEQYDAGKRIGTFPNFLWMQSVVMSPSFVDKLLYHAHQYDDKHDDTYVAAVLSFYKIKAYVHLPSLVQHNITILSSMKHANNEKRTSELFEKDFVTKWKAGKV